MGEVVHFRFSKPADLELKERAINLGEIAYALERVRETLDRLEHNSNRPYQLLVLSTDLLGLLALVQPDSEVESAIDQIYEAARMFVRRSRSAGASDAECLLRLNEVRQCLEILAAVAQPRRMRICR